jgi:hypothetical protein
MHTPDMNTAAAMLDKGFYFCHTFDFGVPFTTFESYEARDSLLVTPDALRYRHIEHSRLDLWVNKLGLGIAFQRVSGVTEWQQALDIFNADLFEEYYQDAMTHLSGIVGEPVDADFCFLVQVGADETEIDWKFVKIPAQPLLLKLLIEATFIDVLCRAIDRKSRTFVGDSNLADERLVVHYVENLFPLGVPEGFLVSSLEIGQMRQYFQAWRLGERVAATRARFSESVANTSLFRGNLEKHRQSAMSCFLAAIAVLSLAQVSDAIADVLRSISLAVTKEALNRVFAVMSAGLLAWGFVRHVAGPTVLLRVDSAKRKSLTRRLLPVEDSRRRLPNQAPAKTGGSGPVPKA